MIDIDQLKNNEAIYVYNKTDSDFLLTLYRQDGTSELAPIPKTFIPIMLTSFSDPQTIKKSSDFRRAISKGILKLVSKKDALAVLENKTSKIELERLRKSEFSNVSYEKTKIEVSPMEAVKDVGNPEVSIKVKDIMMRDLSEQDVLSLLLGENNINKFTKDDLEFIIVTATDKDEINDWATAELKVINEGTFKN